MDENQLSTQRHTTQLEVGVPRDKQYIEQLEELLHHASTNIMCELSKAKMTLHEYGALAEASSSPPMMHAPNLNFDQVNDLLFEQTVNTLRSIMHNSLTPPDLTADLASSIDALNASRKRYGRGTL